MDCYFCKQNNECACLDVTDCLLKTQGKCSFYKTREQYFADLERAEAILRKKGLQPYKNTTLPLSEPQSKG